MHLTTHLVLVSGILISECQTWPLSSPTSYPIQQGRARMHSMSNGTMIYSCLVVSPAGRIISDFDSVKELLGAMRDAIRAHLSLYEVGQILHRDYSPGNIRITKPEPADGFKGMLIGLDLAKGRNSDAQPIAAADRHDPVYRCARLNDGTIPNSDASRLCLRLASYTNELAVILLILR
ncbi:hypothetical protein F5Y10DRAFT_252901 [Nemania abortiva]|nr:hypothetical protein F5Y10DRAFT_252901 [Nemania abortiva]